MDDTNSHKIVENNGDNLYTMEDFAKDYENDLKEIIKNSLDEEKYYIVDDNDYEDIMLELLYEYNNYLNLRLFMATMFLVAAPSEGVRETFRKANSQENYGDEYFKTIDITAPEFPKICAEILKTYEDDKWSLLNLFLTNSLHQFYEISIVTLVTDAIMGLGEYENIEELFQLQLNKVFMEEAEDGGVSLFKRISFITDYFSKMIYLNSGMFFVCYENDVINEEVEFKGVEYWETVNKISEIYKYFLTHNVKLYTKEYYIKNGDYTYEHPHVDYLVTCYLMQKYNYTRAQADEYSINFYYTFHQYFRAGRREGDPAPVIDFLKVVDRDLAEDNSIPLAWNMLL